MNTFKEHADEAQMTEADRIVHRATWDAAIEAAAKVAMNMPLKEELGDLPYWSDTCKAMAVSTNSAIRALQSQSLPSSTEKDAEDASLKMLLIAASHTLRSYQYGNGSPDLAQSMADRIDAALARKESDRV